MERCSSRDRVATTPKNENALDASHGIPAPRRGGARVRAPTRPTTAQGTTLSAPRRPPTELADAAQDVEPLDSLAPADVGAVDQAAGAMPGPRRATLKLPTLSRRVSRLALRR